ncbi:MAG: phage holin family protein [Burkholderiales bacterium]|nr:phage holin family protein [Burkholderiales bacterium]
MALTDSLAQLAATLTGILHTRLELISVELEEELTRFSSMLLWSLTALFCAGIAVMLAILLLVALFWDSHRLAIVSALLLLFSGAAIALGVWLRRRLRNKPGLLSYTLAELKKDSAALQGKAASSPSE